MAVIDERFVEDFGIDKTFLKSWESIKVEKAPVEEPVEELAKEPAKEPAEEPTEVPAEVQAEEPVKEKVIRPPANKRVLRSISRRNINRKPRFHVNKRNAYRDRLISIVDVEKYHTNIVTDDNIQQLICLSKKVQRSQLCGFKLDSRIYFVAVWLTTSRIFEYSPDANSYFEAKRIPLRYIDIHEKLITSVHFHDAKLYIAYISDRKDSAAYLEIRNLTSKLLSKPHHYDRVITAIESDRNFIYIRTLGNILHLHNKNHFELMHYRVDFDIMSPSRVVGSSAWHSSWNPYTKLDLYTATESSLIISKLDALQHSVKQIYKLDERYKTISAHKDDFKFFLHRNLIGSNTELLPKSKLEIGLLPDIEGQRYFVHERCINFNHEIIQVEMFGDKFFLFGCSTGRYEVGCLSASDFKPIWSTELRDVDHDSKIIARDDHVIIFKSNHQHFVVKIGDYLLNDGIMRDSHMELNSSL